MMKRILVRFAVLTFVVMMSLFYTGCSLYQARFSPPIRQDTEVVLRENDFEYIERNLRGKYKYWSLVIGIPGEHTGDTIGLEIPLGDPRLFSKSLARMYSSTDELAEGRSSQLINWTRDQETLVVPLLIVNPTKRTTTFRADLIEYTKY